MASLPQVCMLLSNAIRRLPAERWALEPNAHIRILRPSHLGASQVLSLRHNTNHCFYTTFMSRVPRGVPLQLKSSRTPCKYWRCGLCSIPAPAPISEGRLCFRRDGLFILSASISLALIRLKTACITLQSVRDQVPPHRDENSVQVCVGSL